MNSLFSFVDDNSALSFVILAEGAERGAIVSYGYAKEHYWKAYKGVSAEDCWNVFNDNNLDRLTDFCEVIESASSDVLTGSASVSAEVEVAVWEIEKHIRRTAKQFEKRLAFIRGDLETIASEDVFKTIQGLVPGYIWEVSASVSGKYHPKYALGYGGLGMHMLKVVEVAHMLLSLEQYAYFSVLERDAIIIAAAFHDGMKCGKENTGNNCHEHPVLMANAIRELVNNSPFWGEDERDLALLVAELIETHMGQWTTSKYSDAVLKKPETEAQKFLHLCDYLASRPSL